MPCLLGNCLFLQSGHCGHAQVDFETCVWSISSPSLKILQAPSHQTRMGFHVPSSLLMWTSKYVLPNEGDEDKRFHLKMSHLCWVISTILINPSSKLPYLIKHDRPPLLFVYLKRQALTHGEWKPVLLVPKWTPLHNQFGNIPFLGCWCIKIPSPLILLQWPMCVNAKGRPAKQPVNWKVGDEA